MKYMKSKISFLPILLLLVLLSCNSSNGKDYTDGDYYAEVKYHNPKTDKKSTYTLKVRVEDSKLIRMYWSNGGWLDDSHFTPPDISSGEAKFTTDKKYIYRVKIIERVKK